jgi:hypothetical protein
MINFEVRCTSLKYGKPYDHGVKLLLLIFMRERADPDTDSLAWWKDNSDKLQDDDSLLRSFLTIKPAAEKILSDGTNVDGTAKYRRARTESLEYLSEFSFHHARESVTGIWQFGVITSFEKLPNFRCRRWHFHSPISRNSIQTHF